MLETNIGTAKEAFCGVWRNGRWVAQVMDPLTGKRKYLYAKTRAAAYARLAEAQQRVKKGQMLPDETLTVKKYLEDWLSKSQRRHNLRDSTQKRYREALCNHVIPELGKVALVRLSVAQLRAFYDRLSTEPHPATGRVMQLSSVGKVHNILHTALQDALADELIYRNIADVVRPAPCKPQERPILTPEQANHLLAVAAETKDRWEALYWLELQTGMRESELFGLTWSDVVLTRCELTIRESKTEAGVRKLGLIPQVVEKLQAQKDRQAFEKPTAAPRWKGQELVFSNRVGNRQQPGRFTENHFYPLLERAGLPRIHFHDLRHTTISWLLSLGLPVADVAKYVGHKDVVTTYRRYAHALPNSQQAILAAMQQGLSGSSSQAQAVR